MSERLIPTTDDDQQKRRLAKGVLITIEGSDGSGKGTQYGIIRKRLEESPFAVSFEDFPQYDDPSSYFAREYLNGAYGEADELGAYVPSVFFALDRYDASAKRIRRDLADGKLVFTNRGTGSNMAHQGQKIDDDAEREKYYDWLYDFEYGMLKNPKPDLNIVLHVPADIAQQNVDKKAARSYTDKKRDIHEADLNHLTRSVAAYRQLCEQFPEQFTLIEATKDNEMLPMDTVTELIWAKIQPLLAA
jgi:dTMP kinase